MKNIIVTALITFAGLSVSGQQSLNYKSHEQKLNEAYCSGLFRSTDGTILDVASNLNAQAYINILDWLQGRVAGLYVYTSRTGQTVPVIRGNVPGIFVNEVQVGVGFLNTLPVSSIAMIKVIKTPFAGGFNGSGGAIAIYTLGTEDEEETDEVK